MGAEKRKKKEGLQVGVIGPSLSRCRLQKRSRFPNPRLADHNRLAPPSSPWTLLDRTSKSCLNMIKDRFARSRPCACPDSPSSADAETEMARALTLSSPSPSVSLSPSPSASPSFVSARRLPGLTGTGTATGGTFLSRSRSESRACALAPPPSCSGDKESGIDTGKDWSSKSGALPSGPLPSVGCCRTKGRANQSVTIDKWRMANGRTARFQ